MREPPALRIADLRIKQCNWLRISSGRPLGIIGKKLLYGNQYFKGPNPNPNSNPNPNINPNPNPIPRPNPNPKLNPKVFNSRKVKFTRIIKYR